MEKKHKTISVKVEIQIPFYSNEKKGIKKYVIERLFSYSKSLFNVFEPLTPFIRIDKIENSDITLFNEKGEKEEIIF